MRAGALCVARRRALRQSPGVRDFDSDRRFPSSAIADFAVFFNQLEFSANVVGLLSTDCYVVEPHAIRGRSVI